MDTKDLNLSPELIEEAKRCKTTAELVDLAKKNGIELTGDQLDSVTGGAAGWDCITDCGDTKCNNYQYCQMKTIPY